MEKESSITKYTDVSDKKEKKMRIKNNKSGFTLLEIIIVIIIVGVLASLALPRFFSTVEFARSTEALNQLGVVRESVARNYLVNNGTYTFATMAVLDVEDPSTAPGTHFTYSISGTTATGYTLQATRNLVDGGVATDWIRLIQTGGGVTRSGTGRFIGIK